MIGTLNGVSADRVHVGGIEIDYTFKIYKYKFLIKSGGSFGEILFSRLEDNFPIRQFLEY